MKQASVLRNLVFDVIDEVIRPEVIKDIVPLITPRSSLLIPPFTCPSLLSSFSSGALPALSPLPSHLILPPQAPFVLPRLSPDEKLAFSRAILSGVKSNEFRGQIIPLLRTYVAKHALPDFLKELGLTLADEKPNTPPEDEL